MAEGRGGDRETDQASTNPVLEAAEQQVLQLIATGLSRVEVAEQLSIPLDAVRAYLQAALAKLGARSTVEAIIIAVRRGQLELPPE